MAFVVLLVLLGVPAVLAVTASSPTAEINDRLAEVYDGVVLERVPRGGEDTVVVDGEVRDDCRLVGQWFSLDDLAVRCDGEEPQRARGATSSPGASGGAEK